MRIKMAAFADELTKVADPQAVQAMINKRLQPLVPHPIKTTAPPATMTPQMLATTPQQQNQQMQNVMNKARSLPQSTPQIKTPRSVMGVRG